MLEIAQHHLDYYEVDGTHDLLNQLKKWSQNLFHKALLRAIYNW